MLKIQHSRTRYSMDSFSDDFIARPSKEASPNPMQDFQDVIEDSQLFNAMYDDIPKSSEPWYNATPEEVERLENEEPDELEMPFICNTSLGFYLV